MPLNSLPPPTAGIYPGPALASLLRANESVWLFQNQFFPASGGGGTSVNTQANGSNPYASIAVQLERIKSAFYPFGFSLHCFFTNSSGAALNPGTIELDLQTSDIDTDANYVTLSGSTLATLNGSYAGRIENSTLWAKFARIYAKTITNASYLSVLATR